MSFRYYKNITNKFRAKVDRTLLHRLVRRLRLIRSYRGKFTKLTYPPEYLQIDINAFCNLKCRMCPQSLDGGVPLKGEMDPFLYKSIIDSGVRAGVFTVILALTGEPLLHKHLVEMIRYAKDKGLRVIMSTNCTLLTQSVSYELIKSGLDEIILSFDTVNKELYEDYRRGARFEEVLNNILTFLEIRKRTKSHKPFTVMQNLQKFDPDKPCPQIEKDFWEMFGKYDVWIIPKYLTNWAGIMGQNKLYEESGIPSSRNQYQLCFTIYQRIVVSWDGKVLSCCNDFQRKQIIGDLANQSIAEVWNGAYFTDLRQKLANKEYQKLPLCKNCGALWK